MDNRADPRGAAPRLSRRKIVRSLRLSRWLCGAFALMVIGSIAYLPAQAQQPASARSKVVLQVSDADAAKWNLALNNAKNLQTDLGATNVEVEIVAYGPGIAMLKADSVVGNRIDEALTAGVKVVACENTMRAQKLTQGDMLGKIGYVPAGVVEIMQRQQQGWAYIRP
jgi:intracellular sulfur oxidation DsrE/DsrF family protein